MAVDGMKEEEKVRGMEAIHCLNSLSPPLFLSPSPSLSQTAHSASLYLFSTLLPFCPKSPFDRLLVEGFDAEQIWHQIDLQTKPLIASLRRDVKRLEANPGELMQVIGEKSVGSGEREEKEDPEADVGGEGRGEEDDEGEGSEEEDEDVVGFGEEHGEFDEEDEEQEEEKEEGDEEVEEMDEGGDRGVEDRFFKIKELEEFLEKDEEREYGLSKETREAASEGEDDQEDEDEEEEDDEELEGFDDDVNEAGNLDNIRCAYFSECSVLQTSGT